MKIYPSRIVTTITVDNIPEVLSINYISDVQLMPDCSKESKRTVQRVLNKGEK